MSVYLYIHTIAIYFYRHNYYTPMHYYIMDDICEKGRIESLFGLFDIMHQNCIGHFTLHLMVILLFTSWCLIIALF